MNKLWIDYPPESARLALTRRFCENAELTEKINKLSRCTLSPLAALCDGKSLTTLGNSVEADYGISRASAVVQFLRKNLAIPVSRELKVINIDHGMKARQALYKIKECDISLMTPPPDHHKSACAGMQNSRTEYLAQKYIRKLISINGTEWVVKLVEDMVTASHQTEKG